MTARADSGPSRGCGSTRIRGIRILLVGMLMALGTAVTGCQAILSDMLAGDACGDHSVCGSKAAAAGVGAALAGAAGAYFQRKEDSPSEPWPWEKDEAEMESELEDLAKGAKEQPEKRETEQAVEPAKEQEETTPGGEETPTEGGEEKAENEEKTPAADKERSTEGEGKKKPDKEDDTRKIKAPAAKYVPVTTSGDVTVLVNPETGKVAIGGGRYIGGKDENGYWITQDGKVVLYNERTRNATVSDGHFTVEREGKSYTLTSDNKLLTYDGKGGFEISDGNFSVGRDGSAYGITKDNKVVAYDRASGNFIVSDGRFTVDGKDTTYTVTKDNKVVAYDRVTGNFKISDGHFVVQRENSVTVFTKDKVQLTYNERNGTGSVKVWGRRGEVTVGAGRQGGWLVDGKVKGSINGTPTTFKVSAEQYRLPDTGQQGFKGGVDIQQKNVGLTLTYGKDDATRAFSADVRNRDWTVGFSRNGDNEAYRAGWRNVFVSYGREAGGHLNMAGYTRRF